MVWNGIKGNRGCVCVRSRGFLCAPHCTLLQVACVQIIDFFNLWCSYVMNTHTHTHPLNLFAHWLFCETTRSTSKYAPTSKRVVVSEILRVNPARNTWSTLPAGWVVCPWPCCGVWVVRCVSRTRGRPSIEPLNPPSPLYAPWMCHAPCAHKLCHTVCLILSCFL